MTPVAHGTGNDDLERRLDRLLAAMGVPTPIHDNQSAAPPPGHGHGGGRTAGSGVPTASARGGRGGAAPSPEGVHRATNLTGVWAALVGVIPLLVAIAGVVLLTLGVRRGHIRLHVPGRPFFRRRRRVTTVASGAILATPRKALMGFATFTAMAHSPGGAQPVVLSPSPSLGAADRDGARGQGSPMESEAVDRAMDGDDAGAQAVASLARADAPKDAPDRAIVPDIVTEDAGIPSMEAAPVEDTMGAIEPEDTSHVEPDVVLAARDEGPEVVAEAGVRANDDDQATAGTPARIGRGMSVFGRFARGGSSVRRRPARADAARSLVAPPDAGARLAHVLRALEGAGLTVNSVIAATATTSTVTLTLDAGDLTPRKATAATALLAQALRTSVKEERALDRDEGPLLKLTVKVGRITPGDVDDDHPLPLLVAVGTTPDGAELHVNLAALRTLLVAATSHGYRALMSNMLANVVRLASPERLGLLIATDDPDLRAVLSDPRVMGPYMVGPVADAQNIDDLIRIIDMAQAELLTRFGAEEPSRPQVVMLANIDILSDPAYKSATTRLDALCNFGPHYGIYVVAGTGNTHALTQAHIQGYFAARFARPLLEEEDSVALVGDAGATRLRPNEALFSSAPVSLTVKPFGLAGPDVGDVFRDLARARGEASAATTVAAPCDDTSHDVEPAPVSGAMGDILAQLATVDGARPVEPTVSGVESGDATASGVAGDIGDTGDVPPTVALTGVAAAVATPATPDAPASPDAVDHLSTDPLSVTGSDTDDTVGTVALCLLGGIILTAGPAAVELCGTSAQILAAVAIMGPNPVMKERIAAAVWPGVDRSLAMSRSRNALSKLRKELAASPVANLEILRETNGPKGTVQINPEVVDVDLYPLAQARDELLGAEVGARLPLLECVVAVYKGDLCGKSIDQWKGDWVRERRDDMRKTYMLALEELAIARDDAGEPVAALTLARKWVEVDRDNEKAHRFLMDILYRNGDFDGALAHYSALTVALDARGDKPSQLTESLYRRIMRGRGVSRDTDTGSGTPLPERATVAR